MKGLRIPLSTRPRRATPGFALRTTSLNTPASTSRIRSLSTTSPLRQVQSRAESERPVNVYQTHGRALFKALTLAFLTYQIAYFAWLTVETEDIKDQKNRDIKALEREVRQLDESRKSQAQKSGG